MLSSRSLNDEVVVITGASSGIGRASAILFAKNGARVVLAARDLAALEPVAAECRMAGAEALAFEIDMADEQDVERLPIVGVGALVGVARVDAAHIGHVVVQVPCVCATEGERENDHKGNYPDQERMTGTETRPV